MGEALEVFQCPEQRFLSSGSAKRETALLKITQHMTLPQVKASTKSCHSNDLIADFQVLREIREYIYPHFFLEAHSFFFFSFLVAACKFLVAVCRI